MSGRKPRFFGVKHRSRGICIRSRRWWGAAGNAIRLTHVPAAEYHEIARTRDRVRLAVQVRGSGPTLLLLPGQANNHHWWDRTRGDFDAHHTTVTFDYRGTGASGSGGERYSTRLFAEDALAVMDSLAIDKFAVYGTSMGGRAAQFLAASAPRRVRRLVLGCTTPGGFMPSNETSRCVVPWPVRTQPRRCWITCIRRSGVPPIPARITYSAIRTCPTPTGGRICWRAIDTMRGRSCPTSRAPP